MIKSSNSYFLILLLAFVLISNVTGNNRLEGFFNDKRSEKDKNDMMIGFLVVGSIFLGGVAFMALYNPILLFLKVKDNAGNITEEPKYINFYKEYFVGNVNKNEYSVLRNDDTNNKIKENEKFIPSTSATGIFIFILLIILTFVVLIQTGKIPIRGMQVFFYP